MDINWNKIVILGIILFSLVLIYMIYNIYFLQKKDYVLIKDDDIYFEDDDNVISNNIENFTTNFDTKYNLLFKEYIAPVTQQEYQQNLQLKELQRQKIRYESLVNNYSKYNSWFSRRIKTRYQNELNNINRRINEITNNSNILKRNITKSRTLTYTLDNPAFIREIYIESQDKIPLNLSITVKNSITNIQQEVNMDKYKLDKTQGKFYPYNEERSKLSFVSLLDIDDNPLFGDIIILDIDTNVFSLIKIEVFGNSNKENYAELDTKNSVEIDTEKMREGKIDYIITAIEITTDNIDNGTLNYSITYENSIEDGVQNYKGPVNDKFLITKEYNKIYCFNKLLAKTVTLKNEDTPVDITHYSLYGYIPDNNEINTYKFERGLISFKDSLNPDSVCSYDKLKNTISTTETIVDVLNYQDQINYEINELDKNRYNLLALENQKLATNNLINRINNYSDKYIKLLKANDEYNISKYSNAKNAIDSLKQVMTEKIERQEPGNIDVNININEEE